MCGYRSQLFFLHQALVVLGKGKAHAFKFKLLVWKLVLWGFNSAEIPRDSTEFGSLCSFWGRKVAHEVDIIDTLSILVGWPFHSIWNKRNIRNIPLLVVITIHFVSLVFPYFSSWTTITFSNINIYLCNL